jgi:hypothetical protein
MEEVAHEEVLSIAQLSDIWAAQGHGNAQSQRSFDATRPGVLVSVSEHV